MTDRKIERSNGHNFGWQQLLANSIEIFIAHEKKSALLWPQIYKPLKPFWLLNWVSIARVAACFSLTTPSSAAWGERPQELGRWLCPLNLLLPSGTAFWEIARRQAGAQTWTQTWTLPPDQQVVKVLSPQKSQHKLYGLSILFKSVTDAKFEPSELSEVTFLRLMQSTVTG